MVNLYPVAPLAVGHNGAPPDVPVVAPDVEASVSTTAVGVAALIGIYGGNRDAFLLALRWSINLALNNAAERLGERAMREMAAALRRYLAEFADGDIPSDQEVIAAIPCDVLDIFMAANDEAYDDLTEDEKAALG